MDIKGKGEIFTYWVTGRVHETGKRNNGPPTALRILQTSPAASNGGTGENVKLVFEQSLPEPNGDSRPQV